ncbi:MAG: hypothetical protein IPN32_34310 [Deltaproteobacteria bacterium]|nr:hypothetical protein [Deltaproteobacteria bacterium]
MVLAIATSGELAVVLADAGLRELIAGEVLATAIDLVGDGELAGEQVARDEIDGIAVALRVAVSR